MSDTRLSDARVHQLVDDFADNGSFDSIADALNHAPGIEAAELALRINQCLRPADQARLLNELWYL